MGIIEIPCFYHRTEWHKKPTKGLKSSQEFLVVKLFIKLRIYTTRQKAVHFRHV